MLHLFNQVESDTFSCGVITAREDKLVSAWRGARFPRPRPYAAEVKLRPYAAAVCGGGVRWRPGRGCTRRGSARRGARIPGRGCTRQRSGGDRTPRPCKTEVSGGSRAAAVRSGGQPGAAQGFLGHGRTRRRPGNGRTRPLCAAEVLGRGRPRPYAEEVQRARSKVSPAAAVRKVVGWRGAAVHGVRVRRRCRAAARP